MKKMKPKYALCVKFIRDEKIQILLLVRCFIAQTQTDNVDNHQNNLQYNIYNLRGSWSDGFARKWLF